MQAEGLMPPAGNVDAHAASQLLRFAQDDHLGDAP